jgi:serine protease Do
MKIMSKNTIRTLIIFCVGIVAGIALYVNFSGVSDQSSPAEDSLIVKNLNAQPSVENANQDINSSRQNSITEAVKRLSPAVVGINVTEVREYQRNSPFRTRDPVLREFFPELFKDYRYQQEYKSLGSGFIISADGYILTNQHVVENATEILVALVDGREVEAKVVGTDPKSDVALLKIELENLEYAVLGNSDDVILGEWAIAIGNPFGLFDIGKRATVTVGVISALNRDFGEMERRIYQDMIQTDASINHGNSGGPLCNALGEVIGMNTFIYSGRGEGSVGIGFAIPINRIARLIEELKRNREIDRDFWIGISVKNLDAFIARKMGYDKDEGVVVTYIDRRSPADKAGMELGDIITKVGSQSVSNESQVTDAIFDADLRVGDQLLMQVWREGTLLDLILKLESIKGN